MCLGRFPQCLINTSRLNQVCEFQTGLEFRSEPFISRGLLKTVRGKCFTSKNFSPLTSFASFSPAPSLFRGFFFNSCRHSRTLLALFFLRELPGLYPYFLLMYVQTSPEGLINLCPLSVYNNLHQLNIYKGIGEIHQPGSWLTVSLL